jgi:hypothetical protein
VLMVVTRERSCLPVSGRPMGRLGRTAGQAGREVFVICVATFPGEWLDGGTLSFGHKLLIAGDVDLRNRKPSSLWSNRLVVPGIDVVDHSKYDSEEKLSALPQAVSLRMRDLSGAVLIGATLRKADFTAARLDRALLDDADLRESTFECDRHSLDESRNEVSRMRSFRLHCSMTHRYRAPHWMVRDCREQG